jgi:hypothetical protein
MIFYLYICGCLDTRELPWISPLSLTLLLQSSNTCQPRYVTSIIGFADPDHHDVDPDPACYFDPDPDPSFQMRLRILKKCSNRLIFHTCWLVIDKWMQIRLQLITLIRIRILPFSLMRIRIRNTDYNSIQRD